MTTRLPVDLTRALSRVCGRLGLRKNFVVEAALRENIEDLSDAHELNEAIRNATGFLEWQSVRRPPCRWRR